MEPPGQQEAARQEPEQTAKWVVPLFVSLVSKDTKDTKIKPKTSIIKEQKGGLLMCLSLCCDKLTFCTVLPNLKLVHDDAHSLQWQVLLLLLMLPFVVACVQWPCLLAVLACCH